MSDDINYKQVPLQINTGSNNENSNKKTLSDDVTEIVMKDDIIELKEQLKLFQQECNTLRNLQQEIIEIAIEKDPLLSGPINDRIEDSKKKKKVFNLKKIKGSAIPGSGDVYNLII